MAWEILAVLAGLILLTFGADHLVLGASHVTAIARLNLTLVLGWPL